MKKLQRTLSMTLPALALTATLFASSQLVRAQSPDSSQGGQATQQQGMQPEDQTSTQKTFTGKITKSGDKFVLTDSASKTSYQLDDQQKATSFLNKNVKVTGVLDAATGTIRVTSIDPVSN